MVVWEAEEEVQEYWLNVTKPTPLASICIIVIPGIATTCLQLTSGPNLVSN